MSEPIKETEFITRTDGLYEVRMVFDSAQARNIILDGYGHRDSFARFVTEKFADRYVKEHFDKLSTLIDLDTVKLLATRKLAGVVAKAD